MSVSFHPDGAFAHLSNGSVSLVLEATKCGDLLVRHFGRAVRSWHGGCVPAVRKRSYTVEHGGSTNPAYPDEMPFAYPTQDVGDTRPAALSVETAEGLRHCRLAFQGWEALPGKPALAGLPSYRADMEEAETLAVCLADEALGLHVRLVYTLYASIDALACHVEVENVGERTLTLRDVRSVCLPLPSGEYDMVTLYGEHTREGNVARHPMHVGTQGVSSVTGSSSPYAQPFLVVCDTHAGETCGEVWAMQLVYSGNHALDAHVDQVGSVRLRAGINPDAFSWRLAPEETFCAPEAVVVYSATGFDAMSQAFHLLCLRHLVPMRFGELRRPVLLNSWESMYYDVSMDKIERQAELAARAGMELFVLDDGWFRSDNSSYTSMGDWTCNKDKLPGGIEAVAELVHGKGMQFGLWFEPEAVGPTSELYHAHPDWVLQAPGYEPLLGRHEYLLDLSRADVRGYILSCLARYLDGGQVDYVKWDMNRPLSDVCSAALPVGRWGETAHRYVLGLYELLEVFGRRWPQVIIEGCSSGGCRLDAGMLAYVAQNWASDNTDALDRSTIQTGLSLVYPPSVLGAHVSAVPNHQTGRVTTLDARYQVARQFCLGYELDLSACTSEDLAAIAEQVGEHKAEREWMQTGTFHRLEVPGDNHVAWTTVSEAGNEAVVMALQKRFDILSARRMLRLPFAMGDDLWQDVQTGEVYGGDELAYVGLPLPVVSGDCQPIVRHLRKIYS